MLRYGPDADGAPGGLRAESALRVVIRIAPTSQTNARHTGLCGIPSWRLQAGALAAEGAEGEALAALAQALECAAPEGFLRHLLDHGAPLGDLLARGLARGALPPYAAVVAAALSPTAAPPAPGEAPLPAAPARAPQGLAEPLTEREMEILRYLNGPLSSTEIAGELYLSPNTVRFHIKHLYEKLDAHSRREAVERAQAAGLL